VTQKKIHFKARAFKPGDLYDIILEAEEVDQVTFLKKCQEKVPSNYKVEIVQ